MRAVIEHNLDRAQLPIKVWYSGAFFRAERPQAGRYRQFYQVGIEAIGIDDPAIDAEVIAIADAGFKSLGLKRYRLEITSLGDSASRAAHRIDLDKYISTLELDEATSARAKINPLRLFDDKREEMKKLMAKAPLLVDYLSEESRAQFAQVQEHLKRLGISFVLNPHMVRGLDYYTGTTFEFIHEDLGEQTVYTTDGSVANRMQAYATRYQWKNGLVVKDWRYVVRICNIEPSVLFAQTGAQAATASTALIKLMARAMYRIPNMSMGRAAFYMNRTVHSGLSVMAMDKSQYVLKVNEGLSQFGTPYSWLSFLGVPLRRVDAIVNTEAIVS